MEKIIFAIFLLLIVVVIYHQVTKTTRLRYLETYRFHPALRKKVQIHYPHLNDDNITLVFDTLRNYFFMNHRAGKTIVSMPSQVVDIAWHEFILFTRAYKEFCDRGLGRFLHHTPTEAMKTPTLAQEGIKRAWRLACTAEKIDPKKPDRLPIIFTIDALLMIPDGFHYVLDCSDPASPAYGDRYCASSIGCTSSCASGCRGDSGSDGGGCGGD
jgi:hypothetical protein